MKTVWQYPLYVVDAQFVEMPTDAQILCVQTQNNQPFLWALVDPNRQQTKRKILITGTDYEIGGFVQYIGTFQVTGPLGGGNLVFHVFERPG